MTSFYLTCSAIELGAPPLASARRSGRPTTVQTVKIPHRNNTTFCSSLNCRRIPQKTQLRHKQARSFLTSSLHPLHRVGVDNVLERRAAPEQKKTWDAPLAKPLSRAAQRVRSHRQSTTSEGTHWAE